MVERVEGPWMFVRLLVIEGSELREACRFRHFTTATVRTANRSWPRGRAAEEGGMMPGPLSGVRVLEIGGIGPNPFAGMLFADFGAEVIRVDRMTGGADFNLPASC